jgi:hypothetical protein
LVLKRFNKNAVWFAAIALIYFIAFILPNLKGAQNASMLAVFEIDEYAQYPHLIDMLTPRASFYQSLRNFLIYQHYFYGYPFYFLSALAALPIKLILGGGWPANTPVIAAGLRQLINVLPMIAAAYLLVSMQTRLKPFWKALGLFVFLLHLPAVVGNNLWWHPDSLQVLSGVLVLFFLDRDDLRFGRNFFLAAVVCGVAAGIKYTGFFFFLAVPLYLVWGLLRKKISSGKTLLLGAGFVVVMLAALVITNPLLLLPQERGEVIANQVLQFQQTSQGILQTTSEPYFTLGNYPEDFRLHYGELAFVLMAIGSLIYGLLRFKGAEEDRQRRLLALIAAWIIPVALTINFSATRRTFYFLTVILPLFSCLGALPFERIPSWWKEKTGGQRVSAWVLTAIAAAILLQGASFLRTDVQKYTQALTREETSASIAFYKTLDADYLPKIAKARLVIYRDWHVYFPSRADREIEMSWEMVNYDFLRPIALDLILLDRENLNLFSKPESVDRSVDKEKARAVYEFYRDAAADKIPGYMLIYQDNFGLAFVKTGLYKK